MVLVLFQNAENYLFEKVTSQHALILNKESDFRDILKHNFLIVLLEIWSYFLFFLSSIASSISLSSSSEKESPYCAAAWGKRLVEVIPGMVLVSSI